MIAGLIADEADLTITINRTGLEQVMMGAKAFAEQIKDGTATVVGNLDVLQQLGSTMVDFETGFEILPGTKTATFEIDLNDFEVGQLEPIHE